MATFPRRTWLLLWMVALWASAAARDVAAAGLDERLNPLIAAHEGDVAVAVEHLGTGERFTHRGDVPMPTASLIKLAVLVEAHRQAEAGTIDLGDHVTLREDDKVPGSGILTSHFSAGVQLSLRDCLRLMIVYSDNTATNLVVDRVGLKSVCDTMAKLGLAHTKIHSKVFRGDTSIFPDRSERFGLGSTTATEMLKLLEVLHANELVSEPASQAMLEDLLACDDRKKLPRLLPAETKIAHKTGSVSAVRCAAGIVFSPAGPIAVCVLTNNNRDRSWSETNAGDLLCGRIAKTAYDYFNPATVPRADDGPQPLATGASGRLVEDLQRTLNARLSPAPGLSIDGEFGPVTKAAVARFQRTQQLTPTGVVDGATWKALGPLVTRDQPVPPPEVVNSERLETGPPDALHGPPLVTAKAWAIGDLKTSQLLWGDAHDEPLDMASTTKIMTAYIVLELARQEPGALDDELVFSRRADDTPGSTAALRAGERLPVREALYGLLLPSGNDAAIALAEHFGGRFGAAPVRRSGSRPDESVAAPKPEAGGSAPVVEESFDPVSRFVAEMNRTAERLGLSETRYVNPHGLSGRGHHTTARNLLRLAFSALENPLFGEYVSARQRGATVTGPGGYQRNVLWKNTNRLLPIEGYAGVKTGTTSAAGACLVSLGIRGDDRLIVVVLGSSSSDARYTDSRNLYRWAWRQRGHSE